MKYAVEARVFSNGRIVVKFRPAKEGEEDGHTDQDQEEDGHE